MPNIPGIPNTPRLGQGFPGGGGALPPGIGSAPSIPGLPNVGGESIPGVPPIGRVQIPGPSVTSPGQQPADSSSLGHAKLRIDTALDVLDRVRRGVMEPSAAAKILDDLDPSEKQSLIKSVLNEHAKNGGPSPTPVLQALRYLPGTEGKAHTTQSYAGAGLGLGSAFMRDLGGAVTGLPAGLGIAALAVGKDVVGAPSDIIHGRSLGENTYQDVVKPIAKGYAHTYGPAFHGDFGETAHRLGQHPLGPILDAAAIASAGLGTAARVADVGAATKAGRIAEIADTSRPGVEKIVPKAVVKPRDLAKQPFLGRIAGFYDRTTGELHLAPPGEGHGHLDINAPIAGKKPEDILELNINLDPQSGQIGAIHVEQNIKDPMHDWHNLHDLEGPEADRVREQVRRQLYDVQQTTEKISGYTAVGDNFRVYKDSKGKYSVGRDGEPVAMNFPDKESAVEHAQSLSTGEALGKAFGPSGTPAQLRLQSFVKGGGARGSFAARRDLKKGEERHESETDRMMKEIIYVMEDPGLRTSRRSFKETYADVKSEVAATKVKDTASVENLLTSPEHSSFFKTRTGARLATGAGVTLREATALLKAGAIYLRPAYIPNNWAGNAFMNMAQQGILAPVNIAKSFAMDKHLGTRYTRVIDKAMGENPASVLNDPRSAGYVSSVMDPLVKTLGAVADQPFRRSAFLHEARKQGYNNLGKLRKLLDRAAAGDENAFREIAIMGRKAQEEIVKFGQMGTKERLAAQHIIFVYSWMRGAGRYAMRFPFQHPIQSAVYQHLSNEIGNPYVTKNLGGIPAFMHGVVPVGHDKDGNPYLINPFALNPLGTALQIGQAAVGTVKAFSGKSSGTSGFDPFRDTDVLSLLAPLPAAYLKAREGGKAVATQLGQTMAPYRLYTDLEHPGSGSIYPASRTEALGRYVAGSLYPRKADSAAIARTLERELRGDPNALMNLDIKQYKKLTGTAIPPDLIADYKEDLKNWVALKKFQANYAGKHGHSGFRNLPPANRVDAAIQFLDKQGLENPENIQQLRIEASQINNDQELKEMASELWSSTGIGEVKTSWDQMMRDARGLRLSRKRQ